VGEGGVDSLNRRFVSPQLCSAFPIVGHVFNIHDVSGV
jgi:hypothetical protein